MTMNASKLEFGAAPGFLVGAILGGMSYAGVLAIVTSWDEARTLTRLAWETGSAPVVAQAWTPTKEYLIGFGIALIAAVMLVPFVGMLWMGMRNFRTLGASPSAVARQLTAMIAIGLAIGWIGAKELCRHELRLEQASWVEEMGHRRAVAVTTAKSLADAGRLRPEALVKYGLATNATPRAFVDGWSIPKPDLVIELPKPYSIPASGTVEYQKIVVPTGFKEDKWVQFAEARQQHLCSCDIVEPSA